MKALQDRRLFDALFLPVEAYRARYGAHPPAPRHGKLPAPGGPLDGWQPEEGRLWISGGTPAARRWVLGRMLAQQLAAGRAVLVLQPEGAPLLPLDGRTPQTVQSAREGSYDPLWGRTAGEACRLLVDAAVGTGLLPGEAAALTLPLRDELDYLSRRDGTLSLGAFTRASARELGEAAFAQGDGRLAESHSAPEIAAKLDWLRLHLRTGCPPASGRPLGAALRPGAVTLLGLPQGEAAWAALALSELRGLGSIGGAGVLTVFCELHLDGACRAQVEGLPCGRLFCYQDLPALGWVWQAAADACQAGCVLCHWGESAQVLSSYFGRVLREKPVASRTTSFGQCDSGGPMGLFRTRTVTTSEGYSGSYLWEPEVPEEVIRGLGENEGLLFSQNRLEGFRIPSECTG